MEPSIFWAMLVAAPFIGSFLGLLAMRLPRGGTIGWARSQCDHCGHVLAPGDLIPIASWFWLKGRCRYCGGPIGGFPIAIEFAAMAIVAWADTQTSGWILVASCGLGWTLLLLAVIDRRTQLLPDAITLPLLAVGLAVSYAIDRTSWIDCLVGAAAGYFGFAALAFLYKAMRGRDGLGFGDAKLLAALGAWVAWQGLPTVLLWASILCLAGTAIQAAAGRRLDRTDRIAFGPFLALGGWLVWLYGPLISTS